MVGAHLGETPTIQGPLVGFLDDKLDHTISWLPIIQIFVRATRGSTYEPNQVHFSTMKVLQNGCKILNVLMYE